MQLAKLELINLRRSRTLRSTLKIDNPPKHTQAHTVSDVNESSLRKRSRLVKSYQKAPEPPRYKGKTHQEYFKFICACDQVFDTRSDAYCNNRSMVVYA